MRSTMRLTTFKEAEEKPDYLETATELVPWPSLNETVNTRFAKNAIGIKRFEALLRRKHVAGISDEPCREKALEAVFRTAGLRSMALVDMVIRLILDGINVRKTRPF